MKLIRRGHEKCILSSTRQMPEVALLSLAPRRLRLDIGVRACLHDPENPVAEPSLNLRSHPIGLSGRSVFYGIVQKCGYGLIFITSRFEHDPAHLEQMGHVGDLRALPRLVPVSLERERHRLGESRAQRQNIGQNESPHRDHSIRAATASKVSASIQNSGGACSP